MRKQLTRLFQQGRIGTVEVRNRIAMAPMGVGLSTESGHVTDRLIAFYEARARGGVGYISTGGAYICNLGKNPIKHQGIWDDDHIPGLRKVASAIKGCGAAAFIQLIMPGADVSERPLGIPHPLTGLPPAKRSKEDIENVVELFVQASRRAREAGFNGVEIHGAHGYLISLFLSPKTNPRTDEYGGDTAKRARFACQIIENIKQRIGRDFPIIFRMNGDDYIDGGLTIDEAVIQAPLIVGAGADALSVSASIFQGYHWQIPTMMQPSGCLTHLAAQVKKVVKVPIITAGKLGNPIIAERVLEEGKADFIAMGRPLMADPELPNKAKEGRLEDICPCIYCNLACATKKIPPDFITSCSVNPICGHELDYVLEPALHPKRVMVIGGGLAGMETARILAQRGHEVSLYEKANVLGGQWNIVSSLESEVAALTRYLARGVEKAGVKVFLGKEIDRKMVEEDKPDAVVVATGAVPRIPEIPGIRGQNVVLAWDVLSGKVEVGQEVVIIGGRATGLETALYLAKQGKKVSVVGVRQIARNVGWFLKWYLKESLINYGVYLYPGTKVHSISDRGVTVIDESQVFFLKADTVVVAAGAEAQNKLAEQLKEVVPEIYTVGDAVEPRESTEAIHEGFRVGRQI
jgi:2,4-dienoyl-CoA reductase-like NADH-dependent reductase (Old Yellow Enzyme family)/thioredoxin reductase